MNDPIKEYAKMIFNSFEGVRRKEVKDLKEFDLYELSFKTIVNLEQTFSAGIPVQDGFKHKYWYATKPMTNVAGSIGHDVLLGKQEEEDEITKKNIHRFKVGYHLLTIFFDAEILELIRVNIPKGSIYKLRVVKGMEDTFEDILSSVDRTEVVVKIHNKPQFEKPEPFTRYYHPVAGPMVRNVNPEVVKSLTPEVMPLAYEAINKHMEISYNVNQDVLAVYKECQEDEIFTFSNKELDEEQLSGLVRERDSVIKEATKVGDRVFWEYMFYDYRSRLYSASAYLSHAGSKLSKSLFLYSDKKPITEEGYFWLLVHAANCYGYDKDSIDGRHAYAEEHLSDWLEIGRDPLNNKLWQEADSPYEFLAVAMELAKAFAYEGGVFDYPSGLAVAWDASCSGLQVLSALARDEESGMLCNLTNSEERGDYYLMIAEEVWSSCEYNLQEEKMFERISLDLNKLEQNIKDAGSKGPDAFKEAIAEKTEYHKTHKANIQSASKVYWGRPEMAKLKRKICKRPCMTYFYSCGVQTMSEAMMKDHGSDVEQYAGLTSYYCFWLAQKIYKACEDLMPVPTSLMKLFINLGVKDYKEKLDFSIDAPLTNFKVMQYYRKDVTKRMFVQYKGKEIKPRVRIAKNQTLDYDKIKSSTSPNVVHMLDSQIVAGVLLKADYDVSCIHDSFSSSAADAGKLYEDCREVFVDLFKEDILMEMLKEKDAVELYDDIKRGDLDLDSIYDNEHCFS